MKRIRNSFFSILTMAMLLWLVSCQQPDGNTTGSEYMPDMAHSIAYEANVYSDYTMNVWDEESAISRKDLSMPHLPVSGSIPRGYAGIFYLTDPAEQEAMMATLKGMAPGAISTPVNGFVPYHYADTEEERTRAIAEILANPFPITDEGLARGQELYNIQCGICHGEKGDGAGYLVRDPNPATGDEGGKYPAAPANFLLEELVNSSNGRYYHAIMYGKNVMGGYADKLSYEERWQVIHYIRALQATAQGATYNEQANTLNPVYGVPGATILAQRKADEAPVQEEAPKTEETQGEHHSDGGH